MNQKNALLGQRPCSQEEQLVRRGPHPGRPDTPVPGPGTTPRCDLGDIHAAGVSGPGTLRLGGVEGVGEDVQEGQQTHGGSMGLACPAPIPPSGDPGGSRCLQPTRSSHAALHSPRPSAALPPHFSRVPPRATAAAWPRPPRPGPSCAQALSLSPAPAPTKDHAHQETTPRLCKARPFPEATPPPRPGAPRGGAGRGPGGGR